VSGVAYSDGSTELRWDVALSYASVHREYVERVATALRSRGIRCFFDAEEQVELWGQLLSESLPRVYERDAKIVVVFISAEYSSRTWTNLERRSALRRAAKERREYILPARFDDTNLPGFRSDLVAVDLRERTPEEFAAMVVAKLERMGITTPRGAGIREWPSMWNVPTRLATFTGRDDILTEMKTSLRTTKAVAVVQVVAALHGLGGVGKTQLAIEYCYRNTSDYDVVWWVDAEQTALIAEKIAPLGQRLGLQSTGSVALDARSTLDALRTRDRWLVVFDNAPSAAEIRDWIPNGGGHVLITSRSPVWSSIGHKIAIDILARPESIALLRRRVPDLDNDLADLLAEELGDLPLALEQAAGYLEQSNLPAATYLRRFRARRVEMLAAGEDLAYRGSVDTAWSLTLAELETVSPAAAYLLRLCSWLAPEPIPLSLFAGQLDPFGIASADDPAARIDDLVATALGFSMCRRHGDTIQLHRLVQAVIASRLSAAERAKHLSLLRRLLASAAPRDADDNRAWPRWSALGPHLLKVGVDLDMPDDPSGVRYAVDRFCWHLYARGDYHSAQQLDTQLFESYRSAFGADHPATLSMANNLVVVTRALGGYDSALKLSLDTHARCVRVFGDDNRATLRATNDLAVDLGWTGQNEASRDLHRENLTRCRRVLGDNDELTLHSANNLALTLRQLGEVSEALRLDKETLRGYQSLFPETHPAVLTSRSNIAEDLFCLGAYESARHAHGQVLAQRRVYLGLEHPYTLRSAMYLADVLRALGEAEAARELAEDTLERMDTTLGRDHPNSRRMAAGLAGDLRSLGHLSRAQEIATQYGL